MSNATIIHIQNAPPSLNNIYANVPGRGRVKSGRYKTWRSAAGWDIKAAIGPGFETYACPVLLDLTVEKPRVRSDISNRIKAVEDLLTEMGVIADDSLVMEVRARWGQVKGARIELRPTDLVTPVESATGKRRKAATAGPLLTGGAA